MGMTNIVFGIICCTKKKTRNPAQFAWWWYKIYRKSLSHKHSKIITALNGHVLKKNTATMYCGKRWRHTTGRKSIYDTARGMRQAGRRMAKHLFGSTSHTTFLRAIIEQANLGL